MNHLKARILNSVNAISIAEWESLNCQDSFYFSPEFLGAFEVSNPNIEFKYILIYQDDRAVGLANIQIIELGIDAIIKNIKLTGFLKRSIHFLMCRSGLKILFCGNVFLSGEYGIYLNQYVNKEEAFLSISKAIRSISKNTKMHAIFVKDFYHASRKITDHLLNFGYSLTPVEPNMILKIDQNWKSYDDYKAALKSKYRVKVKKADKTSAVLESILFNEDDFVKHKKDLQRLYENTIANANFNAQVLNLNTYIKLRKVYHENFVVKAYFFEGKLVGFLSALVNNHHLDAHFIGLNYELNKECAIYPRILNDYVRLGIRLGASQINFGRTASEIKSTIGAIPEDLVCYTRHKRDFINTIFKPLLSQIHIKEFKQHFPFKGTKKEAI
ncbi:MAG: hypothetical protein KC469_00280 [Flavobacteriaceae bacterium]|nr:hypothetical protein [Flavobacteriaceae bacterium]